MARMRRTQILLEPQQHDALKRIAAQEQRSLSDIIRDMVQTQIGLYDDNQQRRLARRLQALQEIETHKAAMRARRDGDPLAIDFPTLVDELREERDDHIITRHRR